jgi:hypothetical protein
LLGVLWWCFPQKVLQEIRPEDVSYIEVAYGTNGRIEKIESKEQIKEIVELLKESELKKENLSIGYAGTDIWLSFFDREQKQMEAFYINAGITIRKDPFFTRTIPEIWDYVMSI